jgi:predicted ribosome quality control (RQC) complex YloA/Tae2 family protein
VGRKGKGRPYRTIRLDGWEVLVGRGDRENDELTFDVAAPDDIWMHVTGTPGSHVVVRNPDRLDEIPPRVLERAAQLAGWYSKSRNARRVEVHVCRVRDVSKPPGWEPGKVLLGRWSALRVRPERFDSDVGDADEV